MERDPSSCYQIHTVATLIGLAVCALFGSGCVTQKTLALVRGTSCRQWSRPATLSGTDILDPGSLAQKIITPADPVSEFVARDLPPSAQKQLEAWLHGGESPNQACDTLAGILNQAIKGPSILGTNYVEAARFRDPAGQPYSDRPGSDDLRRLNRRVLEEEWPTELSRMPDPWYESRPRRACFLLVPFAVVTDVALTPVYLVGAVAVIIWLDRLPSGALVAVPSELEGPLRSASLPHFKPGSSSACCSSS
jgi:hypothetical protein